MPTDLQPATLIVDLKPPSPLFRRGILFAGEFTGVGPEADQVDLFIHVRTRAAVGDKFLNMIRRGKPLNLPARSVKNKVEIWLISDPTKNDTPLAALNAHDFTMNHLGKVSSKDLTMRTAPTLKSVAILQWKGVILRRYNC